MAVYMSATKRLFSAAFQIRCYSAPAERAIPAAKQKYVPTSGEYPKGFLLGTSHAGVKASNTKYDDVTLIASEQPCAATAIFTQNFFKAAPVRISRAILRHRQNGFRGVVINSGCANAITGKPGQADAVEMAITADRCFEPDAPESVDSWWDGEAPKTLVMSTGVIGQRLPMDRIKGAIPKAYSALGSSHEHWMAAAQAICTTDTFPKLRSRTFTLPSDPNTTYRIAGITKGAGMIHPNMATLLGVICTDAKIAPNGLKSMLKYACAPSFNSISIDGDTSTNDTIAFFANGAAAPPDAKALDFSNEKLDRDSPDNAAFMQVFREFMIDLAQLVVRDGEGATKFVTIRVQTRGRIETARQAAMSIATSALVKTALYGKDANWGRILCAIGYAPGISSHSYPGRPADEKNFIRYDEVSVTFLPPKGSNLEPLPVLVRGEPENVDEAKAKELLELEDIEILVNLSDNGQASDTLRLKEAVYYTCDFSHEYVTINGDYRT